MRKTLTTALAAVTATVGILATAAPAQAEHRRDGYYGHRRGNSDKTATAVAAGIAGLALGAALSSRSSGRGGYSSGYYSSYNDRYPSYSSGYGYDPRYDGYSGDYGQSYGSAYGRAYDRDRTCITREKVYDPYIGRRVTIERRYAC